MNTTLQQRWAQGEVTFGAWCMVGNTLTAEALARCPIDWALVDMQHGSMGFETAVEMIRAIDLAGTTPIVRVPVNEPGIIGRVLDAGALGILVPMIETADDARRAVDACLYPPQGRRSFGPVRVGLRDGPAYFATANARIAVIPMIETQGALEAAASIAAVPGVSALFLGPYDLSVALGLKPGDNDGESLFDAAVEKVMAAAKNARIATAILSNARLGAKRARQGFQMISVFTDISGLVLSASQDLQAVRQALSAGVSHA